jgi:hypothetical protein
MLIDVSAAQASHPFQEHPNKSHEDKNNRPFDLDSVFINHMILKF